MADIFKIEQDIKEIIDQLKGICNVCGLTGSAGEEIIMTSTFLYKFLNDKFMWNLENFSKEIGLSSEDILNNEEDSLSAFYDTYEKEVAFTREDTITYLADYVNTDTFYKIFDDTLEHISNNEKNEKFSIVTSGGERKPIFTRITEYVEISKRKNFAADIFKVISNQKFDFSGAFEDNFDFYSTIFEYLIKDYNKDSGAYAEYFTPQVISKIIARILVNMSPVEDTLYEIYDPSAGSGSLILHLANELGEGSFGNKAVVYTQDVSQKSTRFLRLNMMLNGLVESLDNIIEGDTLLYPAHYKEKGKRETGLKKFDYITANPPFKCDFSTTRDSIDTKWGGTERFFAGVPTIPPKDKTKMAIYLLFIQHILYSLNDNGKAAIVVPTGFLTASDNISKSIRTKITDNKWLKGVINMPSLIFANTGTSVSIIFIDKAKAEERKEAILIDAANLGTKVKDGKTLRVILSSEEIKLIEDTFIGFNVIEDFSVKVSYQEINEKKYSWSAGQYFPINNTLIEITVEDYNRKYNEFKNTLENLFDDNKALDTALLSQLEELKYDSK